MTPFGEFFNYPMSNMANKTQYLPWKAYHQNYMQSVSIKSVFY